MFKNFIFAIFIGASLLFSAGAAAAQDETEEKKPDEQQTETADETAFKEELQELYAKFRQAVETRDTKLVGQVLDANFEYAAENGKVKKASTYISDLARDVDEDKKTYQLDEPVQFEATVKDINLEDTQAIVESESTERFTDNRGLRFYDYVVTHTYRDIWAKTDKGWRLKRREQPAAPQKAKVTAFASRKKEIPAPEGNAVEEFAALYETIQTAFDNKKLDEAAALLTDDFKIYTNSRSPKEIPAKMYLNFFQGYIEKPDTKVSFNLVVETAESDEKTATVTGWEEMESATGGDKPQNLIMTAKFTDSWIKTENGWRLRKRDELEFTGVGDNFVLGKAMPAPSKQSLKKKTR